MVLTREIRENGLNSKELSFLLGYTSASRGIDAGKGFRYYSTDKSVVEMLVSLVERFFQYSGEIISEKQGWNLRFESSQGLEYFNQHTFRNTVVPWHLFESKEDYLEFFKGYLARRGTIYLREVRKDIFHGSIWFEYNVNISLGDEIAVLLFDLDIIPEYHQPKLQIWDFCDLEQIYCQNLCLHQEKNRALGKMLRKKSGFHFSWPVKEVSDLIDDVLEERISRKEGVNAARKYKIKEVTFSSWVRYGKLPLRVKRYRRIREISEKIGDREVMSRIYHLLKANGEECQPEEARKLGKKITLSKLESILTGKEIYPSAPDDRLSPFANFLFWRDFVEKDLKRENAPASRRGDLLWLRDVLNMYLPRQYLDEPKLRSTVYLQLYRHLRQSPRFPLMIKIENQELYLVPGSLDLAESLLSKAGMGGKQRRMNEAKMLSDKMCKE